MDPLTQIYLEGINNRIEYVSIIEENDLKILSGDLYFNTNISATNLNDAIFQIVENILENKHRFFLCGEGSWISCGTNNNDFGYLSDGGGHYTEFIFDPKYLDSNMEKTRKNLKKLLHTTKFEKLQITKNNKEKLKHRNLIKTLSLDDEMPDVTDIFD
tara:strand:+ start:13 stop:486 length:474 start_codon:yes stop_codon:yes gene_type:complete